MSKLYHLISLNNLSLIALSNSYANMERLLFTNKSLLNKIRSQELHLDSVSIRIKKVKKTYKNIILFRSLFILFSFIIFSLSFLKILYSYLFVIYVD